MMTWTSVVIIGVMRSGGNLSLKTMSIEFADKFDVVCERKKWKKTGFWPE